MSGKKSAQILGWFICLLAAVFYSYDFFIRVAPSVMVNELESDFSISTASIGFLSAGYFYAYIIFQIPAGIILDKYNRKLVISGAMFLCVLGNLLFSIAPDYWVAYVGRILMGVGSAFGFIGAAKLASMWLPGRFFSFFIGLTTILGLLGGFVTDTILETFVTSLGWREGNNVFTYIGLGIFILMLVFIKDNPNHIESKHTITKTLWVQIKELGRIVQNIRFWAASILSGTLFIPINVLASLWGVGFIQAKYGISSTYAAELNSMLFIGNAIGCVVVSVLSAYTARYRLMLVWSCVLLAITSIAVIYIPMPLWLFTALFIFLGASVGPELLTFGLGKAVCPKDATATAVSGVNMANNLVGALLLPLFGWLLAINATHVISHDEIAPVVHTLTDYYYAMAMVPILMILSIPLCMLLPKKVEGA